MNVYLPVHFQVVCYLDLSELLQLARHSQFSEYLELHFLSMFTIPNRAVSVSLFLSAENRIDRGAADRTWASQSRFSVFRGYLLWIFHLSLLFTLHAIVQIGHEFDLSN